MAQEVSLERVPWSRNTALSCMTAPCTGGTERIPVMLTCDRRVTGGWPPVPDWSGT